MTSPWKLNNNIALGFTGTITNGFQSGISTIWINDATNPTSGPSTGSFIFTSPSGAQICNAGGVPFIIGSSSSSSNTGPTGPAGGGSYTGTHFGDYLFYNSTGAFVVGSSVVNIGDGSGQFAAQVPSNISIGFQSQSSSNPTYAGIAIGYQAAFTGGASDNNIAIGYQSGYSNLTNAIAIGPGAGTTNCADCICIGPQAGYTDASNGVMIGLLAGETFFDGSVAIGALAGQTQASYYSISIGDAAGQTQAATGSINIGAGSAQTASSNYSINLGYNSGGDQPGNATACINIGFGAGSNLNGINCINIGSEAGLAGCGTGSICIGNNAGSGLGTVQRAIGNYAIAIGQEASFNTGVQSSICLNASGNVLDAPHAGLYIKPIQATQDSGALYSLWYNTGTSQVTARLQNNSQANIYATTYNIASSSWANTNLGVTITPSTAQSTIRLFFNTQVSQNSGASTETFLLTIVRYNGSSSVNLATQTAIGTIDQSLTQAECSTALAWTMPTSVIYYDAPGTTSSITYYIYGRSASGGSGFVGPTSTLIAEDIFS